MATAPQEMSRGEYPPSLEVRLHQFEDLAIFIASYRWPTLSQALSTAHHLFPIIGPGEEGVEFLRKVYDSVPEERRTISNGDHFHTRVWPLDNYVKGQSTEVMVSLIRPRSNRINLKKHEHKEGLTELKGSPVEGVVVVTEGTEGEEIEYPLIPGKIYASKKGERHTIRNDRYNGWSGSLDIVVEAEEE